MVLFTSWTQLGICFVYCTNFVLLFSFLHKLKGSVSHHSVYLVSLSLIDNCILGHFCSLTKQIPTQTKLSEKYWHSIMKQWTFAFRAKVITLEYLYNFLLFFQVWDLVIFFLSRPGQRLKGGEQRWQKNKLHQLLFARMPDSLAKLNSVSAVTGNRAFPLGTWTPEPRAFISLHLLLFVHMSLTRRMQRRCYVMDLDSGIIWFDFFRRWADLIKGLITFTTVNIMFFFGSLTPTGVCLCHTCFYVTDYHLYGLFVRVCRREWHALDMNLSPLFHTQSQVTAMFTEYISSILHIHTSELLWYICSKSLSRCCAFPQVGSLWLNCLT